MPSVFIPDIEAILAKIDITRHYQKILLGIWKP